MSIEFLKKIVIYASKPFIYNSNNSLITILQLLYLLPLIVFLILIMIVAIPISIIGYFSGGFKRDLIIGRLMAEEILENQKK